MFLILKLVLIILTSATYLLNAYITQDCEIILLPAWNPIETKELSLTLKVFGKSINLNLHRNDEAISPELDVWKAKYVTKKWSELKASNFSFYHEDHVSYAAINYHQEHGFEGHVFEENDILEIRPLQNTFALLSFVDNSCVREEINESLGKPHLVKRSMQYFTDFYHWRKIRSKQSYVDGISIEQETFIVEVYVVVDVEIYRTFMPLMNYDIEELRNIMLRYINGIQDLFYHPSLDIRIDISLVGLDIQIAQHPDVQAYNGDEEAVLDSFCNYMTKIKKYNPRNWDINLYVTGINMKKYISWLSSQILLGITNYDKACSKKFSCALVRFLSDEIESYKNPSLYAAHEIGHLLGLLHDTEEECVTNTPYIMCPGKLIYHTGITWSSRSRAMIKSKLERKLCLKKHIKSQNYSYDDYWSLHAFDNSTCHNYPGREQTAKAQCESFLNDTDANVVTLHDICKNLECEMPRRNSSIFAKGALNGTYCAFRKECCDGECIPVTEQYNFKYCKPDKWSEWKIDSCKSSCLEKSKGAQIKRRFCEHRGQRTPNCPGPYYDVVLCDDSLQCTDRRRSIVEFTTIKCNEFRRHAKRANITDIRLAISSGNQRLHDVEKPWIACTIYCRQTYEPNWYAPRKEMLDCNVNPYFPDGTWCHNEGGQDYYCRQHYCLPENYSFVTSQDNY